MPRDRRTKKRTTVYRARLPDSSEFYEAEYEAVADALHFACRDLQTGRRQPVEIREDGALVHDLEGIRRACAELDEERGLGLDTG